MNIWHFGAISLSFAFLIPSIRCVTSTAHRIPATTKITDSKKTAASTKTTLRRPAKATTPRRTAKAPARAVVVFVIDQFSSQYIPKLRPYLPGGIGLLAREGICYLNAFYDHAMPGTGPGHTLLTTGTYGSVHGIINNKWFDAAGLLVHCDDDTADKAAVFNPYGGIYDYGKSARLTLVDNLSDQLMLHSYPHAQNDVWSLSIKSRSAIAMAGRLGHAVWFDCETGLYTSSKAYFKELPQWVKEFNTKLLTKTKPLTWNLLFEPNSPAYAFSFTNYRHSSLPFSAIHLPFAPRDGESISEVYAATPYANQDLLDLALLTLKNHLKNESQRMVLWLGLSSLDKVGHIYGPQSKEATDMIYHIDAQMQDFMNKVEKLIPGDRILYVLTADHGIQPIPEILKERGFNLARRYIDTELIDALNRMIERHYGIHTLIQNFKEPQFYFNKKIWIHVPQAKKRSIEHDIKKYLLALPGIRRVWTFDELQKARFADYELDRYLARQLYKGRSGDMIYCVNPYTTLDTHSKGTSHITPYAYDTQVPLIFYQKDRFMRKSIMQNVYIPQVSVTLATLLDVPRPSAAAACVLPGLEI